jgi:uncharacterized Zn-binding protein involved in type VI secretion
MSGKPAARVSDTNACPLPGHGPNPVTQGSPDVLFNNLPAARVGDSTACGDSISAGIPSILINGKPVAFLGSGTMHGGMIITGSGDVLVGHQGGAGSAPLSYLQHLEQTPSWISFELLDQNGKAYAFEPYSLTTSNGSAQQGTLDQHGRTLIPSLQRGSCTLRFPRLGITRGV